MKRILCILSAMLILTCGCSKAEETKKADFRNVNWGMTMEEVKAAEGAEPSHSATYALGYDNISVADSFNTLLIYTFENNKLKTASYLIEKTLSGEAIVPIDTYNTLKSSLLKVYGECTYDYSDMAIWETENTTVSISLLQDGETKVLVLYYDPTAKSTETQSTDGL